MTISSETIRTVKGCQMLMSLMHKSSTLYVYHHDELRKTEQHQNASFFFFFLSCFFASSCCSFLCSASRRSFSVSWKKKLCRWWLNIPDWKKKAARMVTKHIWLKEKSSAGGDWTYLTERKKKNADGDWIYLTERKSSADGDWTHKTEQATTALPKKRKFLSHFSLFLTVYLLFKCCFVASKGDFPPKMHIVCLCRNK